MFLEKRKAKKSDRFHNSLSCRPQSQRKHIDALPNMAAMATIFGPMTKCVPSCKDIRVPTSVGNVSCHRAVRGLKGRSLQVRAFFDVGNDPIVKEALKEPVAFLGGVFAGLLRLDLNEEPLREWVAKTAEAAGVKTEKAESNSPDDSPTEIQIE